jgi:membrane associated rhomboid family serine protease
MRRTPPTRRPRHALLLLLLGVMPAVVLPLLWFWSQQALSTALVGGALIAVVTVSVAWLAWLYVLPSPVPVVIDDEHLTVSVGRRRLRLSLPEILVARVDGRDLILLAATPPGTAPHGDVGGVLVPGYCFTDREGAQHTVDAVRARLQRLYGPGLVERLEENERRQLAFQGKRAIVVQGVTVACVVAFGIEVWTNALASSDSLIAVGANASDLVAAFELWRGVTANFLHGSVIHLAMNLAALLSTGALVERWLGRAATVIVLWFAGVGGQLASAVVAIMAGDVRLSVGISGAVFGILGVLLVSSVRFRRQSTGGLRVPLATWVVLIATNGAISTIPIVDVTAHVAGFVVGAATALLVAPRPGGRPPLASPRLMRAVASVVGVLTVASVVTLALRT